MKELVKVRAKVRAALKMAEHFATVDPGPAGMTNEPRAKLFRARDAMYTAHNAVLGYSAEVVAESLRIVDEACAKVSECLTRGDELRRLRLQVRADYREPSPVDTHAKELRAFGCGNGPMR